MKAQEQQVTLRTLIPEEGFWLTDNNGTFTTTVYLGKEDDGSGWSEVSDAEKQAYEASQVVEEVQPL